MGLASENADERVRNLFKTFTEEQRKKMMKLIEIFLESSRKHMAQIVNKMSSMMPTIIFIKEQLAGITVQVIKLMEQYRSAIQNGITNFNNPEDYDSSEVEICPLTLAFSIDQGIEILDDIKDSHFTYLSDRYYEGFEAYWLGDYQKAIFTFLSCLDGILKEFCEQHKASDCPYDRRFPTHEKARKHFIDHWARSPAMKFAADDTQFNNRLKAFFEHRNQIMHGDRYAYFDENIATISLLFLGLVFYMVTSELEDTTE